MNLIFQLFVVFGLNQQISSQIYLHNMRGSNNRLKESTAVRGNKYRLFDSQNNERGGYNHGIHKQNYWKSGTDQYAMKYFQSGEVGKTELTFEWTNEQGCGIGTYGQKTRCNFVLQFMCHDADENDDAKHTLRNGNTNDIQPEDNPTLNGGYHESVTSYAACATRDRNMGLYKAQEKVGKYAKNTRQNPNGKRYGYECAEERDYYPYWHPTEWKDIAVLVDDEKLCSWYKKESFNTRTYGQCVERSGNSYSYGKSANNMKDCDENNGEWKEFSSYLELAKKYTNKKSCLENNNYNSDIEYAWGYPNDRKKIINEEVIKKACFIKMPNLDCRTAGWTRVNHLGNDPSGTPLRYIWKIPHFPSGNEKQCVFRIRYNISTYGYNYNPDKPGFNNDYKIEESPQVNIGGGVNLELSLNPKYLGRTFQDRSHVFLLAKRPNEISDDVRIVNLNVRGKRGNIVQTFPAVEYDFIPARMTIQADDYVHFQWTGSNTHNNNGPGGDGQTGDAGEGLEGTDRSNIVELDDPSKNIPILFENSKMFQGSTIIWSSVGIYGSNKAQKVKNAAIQLASSGYFKCELSSQCPGESVETKLLKAQLNNATPTFTGLVMKFSRGTYHYMCSRNNNFSNRSQKGHIIVER